MIFPPTSLIKGTDREWKARERIKRFQSVYSECATLCQGFPELLKLQFLDPLPCKLNRSCQSHAPRNYENKQRTANLCTPSTEILRDYKHSLIRREKEHCTFLPQRTDTLTEKREGRFICKSQTTRPGFYKVNSSNRL